MKPWLIGEANPYQSENDPDFAMYPDPPESAGGRLCHRILRMSTTDYLRSFERRNLLHGKWSSPKAREAAQALMNEAKGAPFVLLGAKVCAAFGVAFDPFTYIAFYPAGVGPKISGIRLPHPSGLSRGWNEPGSSDKARKMVFELLGRKP